MSNIYAKEEEEQDSTIYIPLENEGWSELSDEEMMLRIEKEKEKEMLLQRQRRIEIEKYYKNNCCVIILSCITVTCVLSVIVTYTKL